MRLEVRALKSAIHLSTAFAVLLILVSLVPGEDTYYRIERGLSHIGPLGDASQHIRSVPATAISVLMEAFQGRTLEVEGVTINLKFAVNPTESVHRRVFASETLGEERTYWVYLPSGYHDSEVRYPTLYLLHGMSQGPTWWTQVARIDRIVTAMIDSAKIRPLIIVMPNGNRVEHDVSTTSLYDNRCQTGLDVLARSLKALGDRLERARIYKVSCDGNFEDYIVRDVVADVDSTYRTNGERYIGGFSIGGRGALQLALGNVAVFDGAFGVSGNYEFLRRALRRGDIGPEVHTRLFLASGDTDQRGLYGALNTLLFHKDLERLGIDHLYCGYDGTHSNMAWVAAIPAALEYLMRTSGQDRWSVCAGS